MANDYIKLWVKDYRALLEPFSEAERGRILWAMMDYKESGSEPSFLGNERFVWAAIKAKIDASNEAYERQAAANRANGARGGRPRKNKETPENQKTEWVLNLPKNQRMQTNSRRHQLARPTESRNPTGSGLDAIRCSRLIWPQNSGACGKQV